MQVMHIFSLEKAGGGALKDSRGSVAGGKDGLADDASLAGTSFSSQLSGFSHHFSAGRDKNAPTEKERTSHDVASVASPLSASASVAADGSIEHKSAGEDGPAEEAGSGSPTASATVAGQPAAAGGSGTSKQGVDSQTAAPSEVASKIGEGTDGNAPGESSSETTAKDQVEADPDNVNSTQSSPVSAPPPGGDGSDKTQEATSSVSQVAVTGAGPGLEQTDGSGDQKTAAAAVSNKEGEKSPQEIEKGTGAGEEKDANAGALNRGAEQTFKDPRVVSQGNLKSAAGNAAPLDAEGAPLPTPAQGAAGPQKSSRPETSESKEDGAGVIQVEQGAQAGRDDSSAAPGKAIEDRFGSRPFAPSTPGSAAQGGPTAGSLKGAAAKLQDPVVSRPISVSDSRSFSQLESTKGAAPLGAPSDGTGPLVAQAAPTGQHGVGTSFSSSHSFVVKAGNPNAWTGSGQSQNGTGQDQPGGQTPGQTQAVPVDSSPRDSRVDFAMIQRNIQQGGDGNGPAQGLFQMPGAEVPSYANPPAGTVHPGSLLNAGTTPGQIVYQVVQQARFLVLRNHPSFEIRLKPEFLGKVTITTSVDSNNEINATIRAEDPRVQQALQAHLGQLISTFQDAGIKVHAVHIQADAGPTTGEGHSQGTGEHHGSAQENPTRTEPGLAVPPENDLMSSHPEFRDGRIHYFA